MSRDTLEEQREEMRKVLNGFPGYTFSNPEKVQELNKKIFEIQKGINEMKSTKGEA